MARKNKSNKQQNSEQSKDFSLEDFFTITACGYFVCLAAGFLFYQIDILNTSFDSFQFVALGLPGGVIFATLRYVGVKQSILYAGVIFLIELIIAQSTITMVIVRELFLLASLWAAVYIYKVEFIPRSVKLREFRGFGLGVILMLTNIVAVALIAAFHLLLSGSFVAEFTSDMMPQIKIGMLLGTGLGLGFELGDRLIKKTRD